MKSSTTLTEKPEISSVGALQTSYDRPSSLRWSTEQPQQTILDRIIPSYHSYRQTEDSSSIAEEYFYISDQLAHASISKSVLQDIAIRRFFLHRRAAKSQYLQDSGTSTFSSFHFSNELRGYLNQLCIIQDDEDDLYEISDLAANCLLNIPNENHALLSIYLSDMPLKSRRILVSSLNDIGFLTDNVNLLLMISTFLESSDKRLAQISAIFLLSCGGELGKNILNHLQNTGNFPHAKLIQGIIDILDS